MEPVISLPFTEYSVANHLSQHFKTKDGYSVFAPLSRQEKGIDLILSKRTARRSSTLTIQIKASRTYSPKPAKRIDTKRFSFHTWFNRFEVPSQADIFALIGLYPPENDRTKKLNTWWDAVILVFTYKEMMRFMDSVKTVGGHADKMFGFGFDNKKAIFQTRGDQRRRTKDYSDFLLENRIDLIARHFKK